MTIEPRWICWYRAVSTQKDTVSSIIFRKQFTVSRTELKTKKPFYVRSDFESFAQDKRAHRASVIEQSRTTFFPNNAINRKSQNMLALLKHVNLSSCNRATACLSRSNNPQHIFMHTMEFFEIVSFFRESCMNSQQITVNTLSISFPMKYLHVSILLPIWVHCAIALRQFCIFFLFSEKILYPISSKQHEATLLETLVDFRYLMVNSKFTSIIWLFVPPSKSKEDYGK